MKKSPLILLSAAAWLAAQFCPAQAANITWDGGPGGTGTDWGTAVNWAGDVLPSATDTVTFTNNPASGLTTTKTIALNGSQTVFQISLPGYNNLPSFTLGLAGENLTLTNYIRAANSQNIETINSNITLAANSNWSINSGFGGNVVVNGAISGAGKSLTKSDNGTLFLTNASTYDGGTYVTDGNLSLTFSGTTTNILAGGSDLTTSGVSVAVTGKNGASSSQTLGNLYLNGRDTAFSIANGTTNNTKTLVDVGTITRVGNATVSFAQPTGSGTGNSTISATNGYKTSNTNDATGIIGAWATAGGEWAANNGTNIVAYTGYLDLAAPTIADGATTNVRITSATTGAVGQALPTTTINTLRVNDATARTVTVGAGNVLRLGSTGGILASGAGGLTIGAAGNAGSLTAGGADDTPGELIVNVSSATTINSVIADNGLGSVSLTKAGSSTLTLGAANTFTGGTVINGGTLILPATANSLVTTGNITLNGGSLNLGTSTQALTGNFVIHGGTLSNGTITKTGSDYDVQSGAITASLGGTAGLTKSTAGTVNLNAANSYTGDTTVFEGTLNATVANATKGNIVVGSVGGGIDATFNGGAADVVANSKDVLVYSNGFFNLGNGDNMNNLTVYNGYASSGSGYINGSITMQAGTLAGSIYGSGGSINTLATTAPANVTAFLASSKNFVVADGAAPVDVNFTGSMSNPSNLVKSGPGYMVATGNSNYTGSTAVRDGTLSVSTLNKVSGGTGSSNIGAPTTVANGTIALGYNNGTTNTTGNLTYTGVGETTDRVINLAGTTGGGVIDQSGAGLLKFSGNVNATGAGIKTLTLQGSTAGTGEIGGAIVNNSATNTTSVVKAGAGLWTLSGASTYTGATTVNAGSLVVSGTLAPASAVAVNGGVFNYTNAAALSNAVTVAGGNFKYNSAAAYTGALTFTSGVVSGSGNLTSTALVVGAGKTVSPGNSTGTLAVGATTLAANGAYNFELNDAAGAAGSNVAGWDLLNISTLDITATAVNPFAFNISSLTSSQTPGLADNFSNGTSYSWLVADAASPITGFNAANFSLSSTNFLNAPGGGAFGIALGTSILGGDNTQLYVTFTAVPEPGTYAMLAAGLMGLVAIRRRRNA